MNDMLGCIANLILLFAMIVAFFAGEFAIAGLLLLANFALSIFFWLEDQK